MHDRTQNADVDASKGGPRTASPSAATPPLRQFPLQRTARPGAVTQLMRQAGNRAVTSYLQRQATPAPAGGTAPPPAPVPIAAPSADESAPVKLPPQGGLTVAFSSGREMGAELNDLSEFEFGQGKLETGDIPVGEFISVSAEIGSHNPITLRQPKLALSPVVGTISAAEVAKNKSEEAKSAERRVEVGAVAAAAGGIGGGLQGAIWGAAAGTLALGPLGTVAGALYGAKKGAEAGGALAGKAADSVYEAFKGDFDVIAHLDKGSVEASIGLHYTPFIRLSLGATGFQWVASISAELITGMDLIAKATFGLAGSNITLHFRDGSLVRTVFTLTPTATLGLQLTAEGRLKLKGSFLNVLEETAGRDKALISGEYITGQFPLFDIEGFVGATTEFQFAKGSAMDVLSKNVKAGKDGTRAALIKGLRASGTSLPFLKKPAPLNERSRTGLADKDAILMEWHKPADWYPEYLYRPSKSGRGEQILMYPNLTYDNGFSAGVEFWPYPGKKLQYRGGEEPRGSGVRKFMRELQEEGIELDRDLAYKADIDHVIDWAFYGPDDETNLWPLNSSANRSAGTTQNRFQKVWWAESKGAEPKRTPIEEVPHQRWFEIKSIKSPGDIKG